MPKKRTLASCKAESKPKHRQAHHEINMFYLGHPRKLLWLTAVPLHTKSICSIGMDIFSFTNILSSVTVSYMVSQWAGGQIQMRIPWVVPVLAPKQREHKPMWMVMAALTITVLVYCESSRHPRPNPNLTCRLILPGFPPFPRAH